MNLISFKGLNYLKYPIYSDELDSVQMKQNLSMARIPDGINETVENSQFFKQLALDTDVYVSANVSKTISKEPQKRYMAALVANFSDPYEAFKNKFVSMTLVASAASKQMALLELKKIIDKLTDYKELTEIHKGDKVIFLGNNGVISYE